jgi:uncharacterized protein (TIGR02246 family)
MNRGKAVKVTVALVAALVTSGAWAQDAVQELANRWVGAYNSHDRAALGALYAPEARLMMHSAPTIAGRKAIEDFWAEDFGAGNPLTVLSITHAVEGSDMILVHGNYQVVSRDSGIVLGQGRFAHIWTREGSGAWLLDRDLWNEPFEPYRP